MCLTVRKIVGFFKTMGDKGNCQLVEALLLALAAIAAGIGLIVYGGYIYDHDKPETKSGDLNRCEQTYVCPSSRARNGKIEFKGTGSGYVATLTNRIPQISSSINRGRNDFQDDGYLVSYIEPFEKTFHLLKGSTVSWEITTLTSVNKPDFYFYKKEKEYCLESGGCNANIEDKQISGITNSYTIEESGDYVAKVSFDKKSIGERTTLERCRFTVQYTRYIVEEDEIEHTNHSKTFQLPSDETYYGCVFVENPCSNPQNKAIEFSLSYHLSENALKSKSAAFFVCGILSVLFGLVGLIIEIKTLFSD